MNLIFRHHTKIPVILLIAIILIAGCSNKKQEYATVVKKILNCWEKGDYTSSMKYWQELKIEEGRDLIERIHLFNVKGYEIVNADCASYKDYEDSIVTARIKSTTKGGSPIEALWKFGLHKEKDGSWKVWKICEAQDTTLETTRDFVIQELKECDATKQVTPEENLFKGSIATNKGEPDQAIVEYTEAIKKNPDLVDAYNNRGCVYIRKRDYDKAISDFNEAIELNPDCARTYYNRALAYIGTADYDQALSDYSRAVSLGHKSDPDFLNMIKKVSEQRKSAGSKTEFNKNEIEIQKVSINLEGIFYDAKGKSSALINSRVVFEGDSVGNAKIYKINEDSVDIEVNGEKENIKVGQFSFTK